MVPALTRRGDRGRRPSAGGARGPGRRGSWWRSAGALLLLALAGGGAVAALPAGRQAVYELGVAWFGPPEVAPREAFAGEAVTHRVDHGAFDELLAQRVDAAGRVDYPGLAGDPSRLDRYLDTLAGARLDGLGRDGRLALLINAYNAFTLRLILDHWPVTSIRDIPAEERWAAQRFRLAGRMVSLDEIEHRRIRRDFVEPRVHFALVCASVGCPPLRREAYVPERLDAQLEANTKRVHTPPSRWIALEDGVLRLTPIYLWYRGDFPTGAAARKDLPPGVVFAARYHPPLSRRLAAGDPPRVRWLEYDWALNGPTPAR